MSLPPRFLDDLRSAVTLSDIIGKSVKLTRAGREFKGCCPFHREKTPSFYVNDDKQFYHCFGCGAHGDAIGFTMANRNLSFIEAVETLAAQAGMQVPQQTPETVAKAKRHKDLHALMEAACRFFEDQLELPQNKDVRDYMLGRGYSEETLNAFRIGYAPDDENALREFLTKEGFKPEEMIEVALLRASNKGGNLFPFFRDRVMFPVSDRRGRIVAFGGRILPEAIRPPRQTSSSYTPPKYLNSSDTPLFHKGRMLYGESHARLAARDGHTPIVVEGYLDVMACNQAGLKGAVAPLGTAMTEEQIISLWGMMVGEERSPVLCFDGDNAGRRAASRAAERILPLLKPGCSAQIAFLPEGEDPDTFIKGRGKAAFVDLLKTAMPLHEAIWAEETAETRFDTPEARAGLEKRLEERVDTIADKTVQTYYRRTFKDKLWQAFSRPFHKTSYQGAGSRRGAPPAPTVQLTRPSNTRTEKLGRMIAAALINHPELALGFEDQVERLDLGEETNMLIHEVIAVLHTRSLDAEGVVNHLKEAGFEADLAKILSADTYMHAAFAKPGADISRTEDGLRDVLKQIEAEAVSAELSQAKARLLDDFSEDSESQLFEMKRLLGQQE
ncbi:MAG: DNA primase [Pseudobdellovibrionaceae bacterium]